MKTNRETPSWLSNKMWSIIGDHVCELPHEDIKVLEPSAGEGGLLKPSWSSEWLFNKAEITCVELNKEKCETLKQNEKQLNVIHADFLNYVFTNTNVHMRDGGCLYSLVIV
jgi:16S rRNA A1518/A1519 N6-dimethyltransferase RsmA/KsgA/DIM1 with predicted DNA glycosylase/AP lyase activity